MRITEWWNDGMGCDYFCCDGEEYNWKRWKTIGKEEGGKMGDLNDMLPIKECYLFGDVVFSIWDHC